MKITRFIILSLLLCLLFQFSAYAEDTKTTDPIDDSLVQAMGALANNKFKEAIDLLEPLVAQGNVRAETLLAPYIFKGVQGVIDKDVNRGLAMIMDAASKGDEDARVIAADLNLTLADEGDTKAMYNIGYMCLNGWSGQDPDSQKCIKWLEKAAELGHPRSKEFLAHIYKNGKYGVPASQNKADYWSNYTPPPPKK